MYHFIFLPSNQTVAFFQYNNNNEFVMKMEFQDFCFCVSQTEIQNFAVVWLSCDRLIYKSYKFAFKLCIY
jgi:hypothetical protein